MRIVHAEICEGADVGESARFEIVEVERVVCISINPSRFEYSFNPVKLISLGYLDIWDFTQNGFKIVEK